MENGSPEMLYNRSKTYCSWNWSWRNSHYFDASKLKQESQGGCGQTSWPGSTNLNDKKTMFHTSSIGAQQKKKKMAEKITKKMKIAN